MRQMYYRSLTHNQTVPAQLMGALSANMPCISLVTGPMLTGSHSGRRVGACTDCRAYWKDFRAGLLDVEELWRVNAALVPTVGVRSNILSRPLLMSIIDLWSNG